MDGPLDIGSRRELFVDDELVERLDGSARLKLNPPIRREVVFKVKPPLENACSGVYSVLVEHDGKLMLYYRGNYPIDSGGGDSSVAQTANVAFSDDGLHFERPELGVVDLGDGGANNIVWQGVQAHNLVPFRDDNPACSDEQRFKAVGGTGHRKLYGLVSPDGVHWSLVQDEPLDIDGAFDSANVPMWDARAGVYRLFSRYFVDEGGKHYRAIQSCTSEDFVNWTDPVPHLYEPGVPREEFYTNATVQCPGAEHLFLSFPMRYVIERQPPVDTSDMDYPANPGNAGMTDAVMMSSRDGIHWKRPFMEAWLRAGLDPRNWTHRNQTPAIGIVQSSDTEWSMYVSEHYGWSDNRLRRLSIRPWGVASINSGYFGGEVLTRPLVFSGRQLRLNMSTSAVGSVAVELQDGSTGQPIEGFGLEEMDPMYGDELDRVVSWSGGADVSAWAGRPVRLRVVLKDADLYALRFAGDD